MHVNNPNLVLGLLAHVDSGKTTLAESILYVTGGIRNVGRVDHGDAFLDTHELEKSRGITIFAKQAQVTLGEGARERSVTLLDTPGHVDFSAETERTLGHRSLWRRIHPQQHARRQLNSVVSSYCRLPAR